ncbi:MAG: UDP-N-acetylmuramate dehydrogenase [Candidatus Liptonbacteria bacterium]|nr:UDP-N-acetylmuramate dehydrogenase [Candidatus Liptonbacteria bacterium]
MFKENFPIHTLTSYKIGGPARYFFEAKNPDELKLAIKEAKKRNLEFFVLGGGTNLLIGDEGFPGLVLKPSINFIKLSGEEVSVGAGVLVVDLINFLIENGLSGLEWAGGLPGTVGGAVRGNAGAFGGEIKDTVKSVKSIDVETLQEIRRALQDCKFGYRSSIFSARGGSAFGGKNSHNYSGKEIILSAVFALKKDSPEKIGKSVNEKISYRRERHPLEYPNAGSIFKNVDAEKISKKHIKQFSHVIKIDPFPVVPAAYIISEAGLKGISLGGAMISPKHPNFIVNVFEAKSSDIKNLINLVKGEVKNKFDIELEEEIIAV